MQGLFFVQCGPEMMCYPWSGASPGSYQQFFVYKTIELFPVTVANVKTDLVGHVYGVALYGFYLRRSDNKTAMELHEPRPVAQQLEHIFKCEIGKYMAAVRNFLDTNRQSFLTPFIDQSVRDIKGKEHPFEIRPNILYRLASGGEHTFEQIYRIVI